jgi:hypothetical protein
LAVNGAIWVTATSAPASAAISSSSSPQASSTSSIFPNGWYGQADVSVLMAGPSPSRSRNAASTSAGVTKWSPATRILIYLSSFHQSRACDTARW